MPVTIIRSEDGVVRLRVALGYVVGCVGANSHAYVIARTHAAAGTRFVDKTGAPWRLSIDADQEVRAEKV